MISLAFSGMERNGEVEIKCSLPLRPAKSMRPLERFLLSSEGLELKPAKRPPSQKSRTAESCNASASPLSPSAFGATGGFPREVFVNETSFLDDLFPEEEEDTDGNFQFLAGEGVFAAAPVARMGGEGRKQSADSDVNVVKGPWTAEEDRYRETRSPSSEVSTSLSGVLHFCYFLRLLVQLVKQYGTKKWSQIATKLIGRIGKQCRERWHNHLRPDIKVLLLHHIVFS